MKKLVLIILVVLSFKNIRSQSSIGLNASFIGSYGIQQEVSLETNFLKKLNVGFRLGTNFNEYSSYKFGMRYNLWHYNKTNVQCGFDLGHLQYKKEGSQTKQGYRTIDLLIGIRQSFSNKIEGIGEIGLSNKEFTSDPIPLILRIGLAYKLN